MTAKAEAQEEIIVVLKKRAKNSSLGFDSVNIVSGEKPRFLHPFQEGSKSNRGIKSPCVTLAAVLNEVVAVQYIGNRQIKYLYNEDKSPIASSDREGAEKLVSRGVFFEIVQEYRYSI